MGNRATISRDQILDTAYALAERKSLSGLGIREVAEACAVSVGSVYNYFPSKAHLVAAVVGRYWERALVEDDLHPRQGEGFLPFCRRLSDNLADPIRVFRDEWVGQMRAFDAKTLAVAHESEGSFFSHIEKGLEAVLLADPSIDKEKLTGPLEPATLCAFVWRGLLETHRINDESSDTLLALLERALVK